MGRGDCVRGKEIFLGGPLSKYLVTGVAGFIGRSIAAALLARGETVRGIDSFITGKRSNLVGLEAMEFIEGDLADPAACAKACAGVEIVFHEAALASVPRSVADPVATNVNCVDATLESAGGGPRRRGAAGGLCRVVVGLRGYADAAQARRDAAQPHLALCRGQAGRRALHDAPSPASTGWRRWCCATSTSSAPTRTPPRTTPACWPSSAAGCWPGEQPTIYGDGEQSRDFTYIDNVVHANLLAAAAPAEKVSGRMMNLATGSRITLNETFEILRELTGYSGQPAYAPARAGDIRDSLADIRLAGELLGYAPIVDFREGLRRTVEWYRSGGGGD